MKKIKFRLYRTFWGYLIWQFFNLQLPLYLSLIFYYTSILNGRNDYVSFGIIFFILILPFILLSLCRDCIVIKGNKMLVKTSYWPSFFYHIDISSVTNVHYQSSTEEKYIGGLHSFWVTFSKTEYTICFNSKKGYPQYITTKDHAKLYALLKAREKIE